MVFVVYCTFRNKNGHVRSLPLILPMPDGEQPSLSFSNDNSKANNVYRDKKPTAIIQLTSENTIEKSYKARNEWRLTLSSVCAHNVEEKRNSMSSDIFLKAAAA